ncbi:MAG: hypothetical protein P4L35_06260, partial [Ignavibacteriaceae bacterium]|nr:hypothetical protein [Ignavibacteriaceae bacterium]
MKVKLLQFFAVLLIMASCTQAQWNWGQTDGQQVAGPLGTPAVTYSTFGSTNNNNSTVTLSNGVTGVSNYYQRTVAVDASGNTYIACSFDSSDIYIGSSANSVSAVGKRTICLYKLNSAGTLQWYRRIGAGFGYCEVNSIVLDAANNKIVMSGNFSLTISPNAGQTAISFESNTPGTFTNPLECSDTYFNSPDGFVACFNTSGTFQWANQVTLQNVANFSSGSGGIELAGGIGADGLGNYYVGGFTQRYDMQVKGVSTLNFNRFGADSSFYSANGNLNTYNSNSWIGGPSLAGKNISVLYNGGGNSTNLVAASGTNLYMSYDGGVNWRQIDKGAFSTNITSISGSSSGPWLVSNSTGLYYGLNTTSSTAGIDWLTLSTTPNITCVNYNSAPANLAYGTSNSGLYYDYNGTTTGGISWTNVNSFSSPNIVSVTYANTGKTLLAGVSNDGIWYATRGATTVPFGSTWTKAIGIYNQNVYCVNPAVGNPGFLIAAADSGVYVSYTSPSQNGTEWQKSGPGPIYSDASVLLPVTSVQSYPYSDPVYGYNYKYVAGTSQGAYVTYSFNGGNTWTPWAKVGNGLNGQSIPINGILITSTSGAKNTWFATSSAGVIYTTWTGLNNTSNSSLVYSPFIFIKFNSSGQAQWMTSPKTWSGETSASNCMINDIVADNTGFYVAFENVATAGLIFSNPGASYLTVLAAQNSYSCYYAKFDLNGLPLWAHMTGLPNAASYPSSDNKRSDLFSYALDGSGNLFAAGYSQSNYILFDGISALTNPNFPANNCIVLGKFSASTGNCTWAAVDGYGVSSTNGAWGTSIGINPATGNILISGSSRGVGMTLANSVITPPVSAKFTGFLAAYHDNGSSVSSINAVQLSPSATGNVFSGSLSVNGTHVAMTGEFDNDNLTLLSGTYPKQAT